MIQAKCNKIKWTKLRLIAVIRCRKRNKDSMLTKACSKVKLLYDLGHHCYLHWVVMDSICWQGLHQGQIPSDKAEQVNRNSATYTSSLSTGGFCTTDRVGFKLQSLRSHSHLQWQADRFVSGLWQREGGFIDQFKGTNHLSIVNDPGWLWVTVKHSGGLTSSQGWPAAHSKSCSSN